MLELLADPQAQERMRRSEADIACGDVLDEQEVRALLKQRIRTPPE